MAENAEHFLCTRHDASRLKSQLISESFIIRIVSHLFPTRITLTYIKLCAIWFKIITIIIIII